MLPQTLLSYYLYFPKYSDYLVDVCESTWSHGAVVLRTFSLIGENKVTQSFRNKEVLVKSSTSAKL